MGGRERRRYYMKKFLLMAFSILLVFSLCSTGKVQAADDVTGNYHERGLRYLIMKGALTPDANGNYNPNATVTRGQFAAFISRVIGLPKAEENIDFKDVPTNSPYYQDIQNAAASGIITGYEDGTFKPNDPITRQHMAVMIERAMKHLKIPTSTAKDLQFKDKHQIYKEYYSAVATGAEKGIIQGSTMPDGVYFYPLKNTPVSQAATFIIRMMEVAGNQEAINFGPYELKDIQGGQLVSTKITSFDYDAVLKSVSKDTHVITKNNNIVYMKPGSGFVVAKSYTVLDSETVKDKISVASETEMQYLQSEGNRVKVNLAGQVGYVDANTVSLIPFSLSKGRHYYLNVGGEMKHVLVDHKTGNDKASYIYGKAPSQMKPGVKYYSWDGINFYNGGEKFTYYNYYQFLPVHSKTQYSAEEIDKYIQYALAEREKVGGRYVDASKKSKLIGLGKQLKAIEEDYGINAMMILALAMHESDMGMSDYAQQYNNLFGLYVYDTDPLKVKFDSPEASIRELMEKFWWKNYIPANAPFAHGPVFGTKRIGFNVKYASDPYWGAKAAGHYYRADKYLGFKDANNAYTIGLTNIEGLNVRSVATTYNNTPIYQYSRTNIPVIITSTNLAANGWYEIIPDSRDHKVAYVSSQYVIILDTVK